MVIDKKGETSIEEKSERPVLFFRYNEKVGDIPNDIFSFLITTIMDNFDVTSR